MPDVIHSKEPFLCDAPILFVSKSHLHELFRMMRPFSECVIIIDSIITVDNVFRDKHNKTMFVSFHLFTKFVWIFTVENIVYSRD